MKVHRMDTVISRQKRHLIVDGLVAALLVLGILIAWAGLTQSRSVVADTLHTRAVPTAPAAPADNTPLALTAAPRS
ncbi:hypothetical protein [Haliangium sp.]|uniref:hypothetical protein n=1 Tax=Haliangium sp. TaxID=2663208 RepID=UPI003D0C3947